MTYIEFLGYVCATAGAVAFITLVAGLVYALYRICKEDSF